MKKPIFPIFFLLLSMLTYSQNIIESNNKIAFDLYKLLNQPNENLVFSPASITSAMAMVYSGSKGNTFEEIANTFHFNKNIERFNKSYTQLIYTDFSKKTDLKLLNANSLWVQNGLKIKEEFLKVNKEFYSSSLYTINFAENPESSRLKINKWVEEKTENKIKGLLRPSSIDNTTRLVLVNALYFKGLWDKKFKKENNTEGRFQTGKKEFKKVTFMNGKITSAYYKDKYCEIIDIPYSNNKFSLSIVLPKSYKKLKKLERKFDYDYYTRVTSEKSERFYINLSIPKFDIESEFDLEKTLKKLGIKDAFSGLANFTGITENEKLYINKVVHKATIKIDEEGTEAAAATAVIMRKTSMLAETIDLKIDRPFIYIVKDNETKTVYFIGKISNP